MSAGPNTIKRFSSQDNKGNRGKCEIAKNIKKYQQKYKIQKMPSDNKNNKFKVPKDLINQVKKIKEKQ